MSNKKRPHKSLSLLDKMKILDGLKAGKTLSELARQFGIGVSTVSDIKNKGSNLKSFAANCSDKNLQLRKTLRTGRFPRFEERLHSWFLEQQEQQKNLSREIVCQQAIKMFENMYGSEKTFNASAGWYQKFKTRFNLQYSKTCGVKNEPSSQAEDSNLDEWNAENHDTDSEGGESLTSLSEEDDEAEMHGEKMYVKQISNAEAVNCLNKCILWAKQKDLAHEKVIQLTDLRNEALELCTNSVKQKQQ